MNIVSDISDKAANIKSQASDIACEISDKASSMKNQATGWLSERGDELYQTEKKLVKGANDYVSANPWKAIGIAALAALVVGRLMK